MINFHARDVAESDSVASVIDKSRKKYPRAEELFSGLQWVLARDPHRGVQVSNPYWLIKTADSNAPGVPVITALYRFDDDRVEIEAIRIQ